MRFDQPACQSLIFDTVVKALGRTASGLIKPQDERNEKPYKLDAIRGARTLLIEDNLINQKVAVGLLESEQFIVDVASNGQEGVDKYLASASAPTTSY